MRALTLPYRGFACLFSLASLALSAGCSSDSGPQGSGGTVASSSGGLAGGATTGGSSVTTGGSATGGAATGGAATGGNPASTGGASPGGSGGTLATGGAGVTGGKSSAGGTTTAGSVSTGGSAAAGANGSGGSGGKAGTGGAAAAGAASEGGATSGTFTVTSPGWMNMTGCAANMSSSCANLPTEITRSGAGTSPELHWTGAPAGTKSFAVVLQDLSGGSTHWVIWNIPSTTTTLPANVDRTTAMPATPAGAQQCGKGTDAATKYGYIGPGAPCNVYEFKVYALSAAPFSPTSTTDPAAVRTQLNALDAGTLLGTTYSRGRTNMTCN